jgi:hypothetical protein
MDSADDKALTEMKQRNIFWKWRGTLVECGKMSYNENMDNDFESLRLV